MSHRHRAARNCMRIQLALLVIMTLLAAQHVGCRKDSTDKDQETPGLATAANVVTVGVVADSTGFMTPHGQGNEMGARIAERVLNARGGILGRRVVLHVVDGASDPAVTAERTKELIERRDISLLLGTTSSATTLAAVGPATDAKVPFVYSLDGECKTCQIGNPSEVSKYVWGSGFTERMVVEPLLRRLEQLLVKSGDTFKIYFLGGDYVYPRTTNGFAKETALRLGYSVVGDEYADTSTTDYASEIRKILAAEPDLLIVTNPGESGVRFMKQARMFNLQNSVAISGFATFDQEMIKAMGTASEGVLCINRYSNQLKNSENDEFVRAFQEQYPNEPLLPGPTAAAGTYGSFLVAAAAFEMAGSTDPEAFYEAMKGLELGLPQGRIRVNPDNNIFDQPIYIMRIKNQQYEVVADLGMQLHPGLEGCSVK